jgi:hypothetical protein
MKNKIKFFIQIYFSLKNLLIICGLLGSLFEVHFAQTFPPINPIIFSESPDQIT